MVCMAERMSSWNRLRVDSRASRSALGASMFTDTRVARRTACSMEAALVPGMILRWMYPLKANRWRRISTVPSIRAMVWSGLSGTPEDRNRPLTRLDRSRSMNVRAIWSGSRLQRARSRRRLKGQYTQSLTQALLCRVLRSITLRPLGRTAGYTHRPSVPRVRPGSSLNLQAQARSNLLASARISSFCSTSTINPHCS